jgi:hypothetical protein
MILAFQGESLALEPTLVNVGVPLSFPTGSVVTFYWSTNALGPWWTKPASCSANAGRLHADWSPTNDMGAAAYIFYLGVTDPSGTRYRAYGRLSMRTSPGFTPYTLPPPATLANAFQSTTNWVTDYIRAELSVHTNRIDNPHGTTPEQIGAVTPGDASNIVFRIQTPATNDLWSAIAGAPRWPTYDWGTHSNVVFVLSNSVLYLLNN